VPLKRRRSVGVVELPKGVHRVVSRGREYFYWQPGRSTRYASKRVRLPNDPQSPEFWVALREAQGASGGVREITFGAVCDLYQTSVSFHKLTEGTKDQYRRQLRSARAGFGAFPVGSMRPNLIREVVEGLAERPGQANNFLGVMRAVSAWAVARDYLPASITAGVKPFPKEGGHRPWTEAQIAAAHEHLSGPVRRGIMLALYTGQRGSDVVRLAWTDVDEGGFRLTQRKTKREVWCPIVPELAVEMATWEKLPGPFLRQNDGKPYSRKLLSEHFAETRAKIPALAAATIHGLRSTAVVRLRRAGLTTPQIQDVVGMSLAMIERYSRFADRKASGLAAVVKLSERK
jgi:integrase